jgi:hypothetical protein
MLDLSLFPKHDQWGTGDESLDLKLSQKLIQMNNNLTLQAINEFYELATTIKKRVYNPAFSVEIELMIKALLAYLEPESFNDHLVKKLKGKYYLYEKVDFEFKKSDILIDGLRILHKFRYEDQIDFYLQVQDIEEKNPYIVRTLKKYPYDLQAKIVFKEFRQYLSNESLKDFGSDELFLGLHSKKILNIQHLGEFWFHQDQIYCLSVM